MDMNSLRSVQSSLQYLRCLTFDKVRVEYSLSRCRRQSQLAKMTSDLCEDGGDKDKQMEDISAAFKTSPVSPLEEPGPWDLLLSPVTLLWKHESEASFMIPMKLVEWRLIKDEFNMEMMSSYQTEFSIGAFDEMRLCSFGP